jgi:hypothetical protein
MKLQNSSNALNLEKMGGGDGVESIYFART